MKAYSYIRWSTPAQAEGASLRRQTDRATEWAETNGVELDSSTYQDHGISAFRGKNVAEGKLGTFLKAVADGSIATPCYLLVEELDRLSRDSILKSQRLFLDIIDLNITIVVLKGNGINLSTDTLKGPTGMMLLFGAMLSLALANEESEKKSGRLRHAFAENRKRQKQGQITTRYCPSWLTAVEKSDGTLRWIVDTARVAVIKEIVKHTLAGKGSQKIAQLLNGKKIPLIGPRAKKGWKPGNVAGILRQPSLCGRLVDSETGEIIREKYYPEIISVDDWLACQSSIGGRNNSGGYRGLPSNLFAHLSRCAYCDSNLKFTTGSMGTQYLYCLRSMAHDKCNAKMIRYEPVESDVISYLTAWMKRDIRAAELEDTNRSLRQTLQYTINSRQAELDQLVKIASLPKIEIAPLAQKMEVVQVAINAARAELAVLNANPRTPKAIDQMEDMLYELTEDKTQELRLKVQTALRAQITKILIAPYLNAHPKFLKEFGVKDRPRDTLHMVKIIYKDGSEGVTDVLIEDRRKTKTTPTKKSG